MKLGGSRYLRRSVMLAAACILAVVLTACTGRGGGQLPPGNGFTGAASFGFSFSCEDKGGINQQTGQLKIELSYNDKGSNTINSNSVSSPFGIHGTVDELQPVVESAVCSGKVPPPEPKLLPGQLIFLGRYRLTSGSPSSLSACPTSETTTMCRFEVDVQDNDKSQTPSQGDSFKITLSNVPVSCPGSTLDQVAPCSHLPEAPGPFPYTRGGKLSSGNVTVDKGANAS
jgi:hypothetical protein